MVNRTRLKYLLFIIFSFASCGNRFDNQILKTERIVEIEPSFLQAGTDLIVNSKFNGNFYEDSIDYFLTSLPVGISNRINWEKKSTIFRVSDFSCRQVNENKLFAYSNHELLVIDADSGSELWRIKSDFFLASGEYVINLMNDTMKCIRSSTQEIIWTKYVNELPLNILTKEYFLTYSNIKGNGKLFFSKLKTGQVIEEIEISDLVYHMYPLNAKGDISIIETEDSFVAIHLNRGEVLWRVEKLVKHFLGYYIVSGNMLIINATKINEQGNKLIAFDINTGDELWSSHVNVQYSARPCLFKQSLIIGSELGDKIYFISIENGKVKKENKLPKDVILKGELFLTDIFLYYGAVDGGVYVKNIESY